MAVASTLPPDVYERDGKWYRRKVIVGFDEQGEYEEDDDREVILPIATDEASIHASRERAAKMGMDFYDPRIVRDPNTGEAMPIGWLDRGKKRHEDWPWNLGRGEVKTRRRPKPAAAPRPRVPAPMPAAVAEAEKDLNNGNG